MIPPRTWGIYARRAWMVAQRNGHQVYDQSRFEEAVALDGLRRLEAQALLWWQTYVITPERLAEGLVDGDPGHYWERRE